MGNEIAMLRDGNDGDEVMPARSDTNWPKGLRIKDLKIKLDGYGRAEVKLKDGATLEFIPNHESLARFLNDHVQGAVENLSFSSSIDSAYQAEVFQKAVVITMLDEMTVPGRLHVNTLSFNGFFDLSLAGIERILDGRTLCANTIVFTRLKLWEGIDANNLFKMPTVRQCSRVSLSDRVPHKLSWYGPPPLFDNNTLVEWLEQSDGRPCQSAFDCPPPFMLAAKFEVLVDMNQVRQYGKRALFLDSDYLSSGPLSFLDALKMRFELATRAHTYYVEIRCPSTNGVTGGLGVRNEVLSHRGERMVIEVSADPAATETMRHPFETLTVMRVSVQPNGP